MTKDVTTSLRELVEKASKSPLPWRHGDPDTWVWCQSEKGGERHVLDVRGWGYFTGGGHGALGLSPEEAALHMKATGDLAVAAVNALPGLLDEIEGLRALVDGGPKPLNRLELAREYIRQNEGTPPAMALDAVDGGWRPHHTDWRARALSAEGEVAELRANLDELTKTIFGWEPPPGTDKGQRMGLLEYWARVRLAAARLSIGKGNGEGIPGSSSTAASSSISSDFGQVKP